MSIKKTLAGLLAGTVVAGAALVAAAAPASANDEGPVIPGDVLWFNTAGPLAGQTPATQIFSGANAATGGPASNGRPWITLTTEGVCPADTANLVTYVRIPQSGEPEINWNQVQLGAVATAKDASNRFYTTTTLQADRLSKPEILAYTAANGGTGVFPFISVCKDAGGASLGNFRSLLTVTGTTSTTMTWAIDSTPITVAKTDTTTTLAVSDADVEAGTSVDLTATVAPSAAGGSVEFFNGATSLGTATIAGSIATLSTTALPVGTNSVTAVYAGDTAHNGSTSAPVSVVVTAVPARATTTVLDVTPDSGNAFQPVTLTATVTAATGTPAGTVTFKDGALVLGSAPVTAAGTASITTNGLGYGLHNLTADFVGTAPYTNSSGSDTATYTSEGAVPDEQTVTVTIPAGAITITTPYTPTAPLSLGTAVLDPADATYSASAAFEDIVITDTRAGNLGWTASVVSGAFTNGASSFPGIHSGLTSLAAQQVTGNALQASNVVVTNHAPFTDGLGTPKVFATYAAGQQIGTAHIEGVFGIDQVPTSVAPGLYTATVTFTAV